MPKEKKQRVCYAVHDAMVLFGVRRRESTCANCSAVGRCHFDCSGDHEIVGPGRDYRRRVDRRTHLRWVKEGRRASVWTCRACKSQGPCYMDCPGDGPGVDEARRDGDFVLTDAEPGSVSDVKEWLAGMKARFPEIRTAYYPPELVRAFVERFEEEPTGFPPSMTFNYFTQTWTSRAGDIRERL